MGANLDAKKKVVAEVADVAARSSALVTADFSGLNVVDMTQLRADARASNVYLKVVKNNLIKLAVADSEYDVIRDSIKGPMLLAFSAEEPGSAARLLRDFGKTHDALKIRVIAMGGRLIDPADIDAVANLPTRDEAISRLMGTMKAPIAKLVRTLAAPQVKLVQTLAAIREQKQ